MDVTTICAIIIVVIIVGGGILYRVFPEDDDYNGEPS